MKLRRLELLRIETCKKRKGEKTIKHEDEGIKKNLLNHVGNISGNEIGVAPVSGPLKIPTQH
jgi:hypothetical protein